MLKDVIVEGCDRLGKDSLIQGIQHKLGFFQEIHYQKPKLLDLYVSEFYTKNPLADLSDKAEKRFCLQRYQIESFWNMFRLLSQPGKFIMNRAHLGEYVYSPRYRNYSGDYVFDLERQFTNDQNSKFTETTLLVLLTTSDFSFVQDDGLSFDFSKKEEEQDDFKKAFNKSTIKNKILIDVSNGNGFYRDAGNILKEVTDAYCS